MKELISINNLTDIEVLNVCKELWFWLYKHPEKDKYDWPKWDTKYLQCTHCCPCCEKAGRYRHPHQNCDKCLLKEQFKKGEIINFRENLYYCENYYESPWYKYQKTYDINDKREYANEMLEIINKTIAELDNSNKENIERVI